MHVSLWWAPVTSLQACRWEMALFKLLIALALLVCGAHAKTNKHTQQSLRTTASTTVEDCKTKTSCGTCINHDSTGIFSGGKCSWCYKDDGTTVCLDASLPVAGGGSGDAHFATFPTSRFRPVPAPFWSAMHVCATNGSLDPADNNAVPAPLPPCRNARRTPSLEECSPIRRARRSKRGKSLVTCRALKRV